MAVIIKPLKETINKTYEIENAKGNIIARGVYEISPNGKVKSLSDFDMPIPLKDYLKVLADLEKTSQALYKTKAYF